MALQEENIMANKSNEANFQGRLTKDAAYSVTPTGTKVFKISIAVPNGKPKKENGQLVKENGRQVYTDDVLFIEATAFNKAADDLVNGTLNPLLVKGATVKLSVKFEGVNTYPKNDGSGMGVSVNWSIRSYDDVSLVSPPKPKTQGQGQGQGYSQQQSQGNNGGQTHSYGNQQNLQQQQYNNQQTYGNQQYGGQSQEYYGNQQFGNPNGQNPNDDLPF